MAGCPVIVGDVFIVNVALPSLVAAGVHGPLTTQRYLYPFTADVGLVSVNVAVVTLL